MKKLKNVCARIRALLFTRAVILTIQTIPSTSYTTSDIQSSKMTDNFRPPVFEKVGPVRFKQ
jgi:hypothetical protein